MKYSKEVFNKAENEINRRRIKALSDFELKQAEIEQNAPEIAVINQKIINTSVELSKVIMSKTSDVKSAIEKIKQKNLDAQRMIREFLVDFGYPEDYLDLHFTCTLCNDTGFVEGQRCRCFNDLLRSYSIDEVNQNSCIKLCEFNNFNLDYYPEEVDSNSGISPKHKMMMNFNACKQYVNNFNTNSDNLFFCGKTGLGKTFLSSAIASELLKKGYKVAFDSVQNYLKAIENEHFGRANDKDTLQALNDADLVILDDLGSEFNSPFYSSALYNIINTRLNKNVPTIISSNLSIEELRNKYDDRLISRITGMFSWFIFLGKDIRHQIAMKK